MLNLNDIADTNKELWDRVFCGEFFMITEDVCLIREFPQITLSKERVVTLIA